MTRRAILIPSPGPLNTPENQRIGIGISKDCVEWRRFLCSNAGGAWDDDDEIVTLNPNPSVDEIQSVLAGTKNVDYSFVAFSGHGKIEYDKDDEEWVTKLLVNESDKLPDYMLRPLSPRSLISVDSCRWDPSGIFKIAMANESAKIRGAYFSTDSVRLAHRRLYDDCIQRCERGAIFMYACDYTEEASAAHTRGGKLGSLFTFKCVEVAETWYKSARGNECIKINDAFPSIQRKVGEIEPEQKPQLHGGRRLGYYPLAVKAV